jgi:hypothetical protein
MVELIPPIPPDRNDLRADGAAREEEQGGVKGLGTVS